MGRYRWQWGRGDPDDMLDRTHQQRLKNAAGTSCVWIFVWVTMAGVWILLAVIGCVVCLTGLKGYLIMCYWDGYSFYGAFYSLSFHLLVILCQNTYLLFHFNVSICCPKCMFVTFVKHVFHVFRLYNSLRFLFYFAYFSKCNKPIVHFHSNKSKPLHLNVKSIKHICNTFIIAIT